MKKIILIIPILLNCLSLFSQEKDDFVICRMSFKSYDYEFVQNKIAKEWGIELLFTDSSFSKGKNDSISKENGKIWKRMDSIHGENAKIKFDLSVKNEYERARASKKQLTKSNVFHRKAKKLKKENVVLGLTLINFENKNKYTWILSTTQMDTFKIVEQFEAIVFLKENKIEMRKK